MPAAPVPPPRGAVATRRLRHRAAGPPARPQPGRARRAALPRRRSSCRTGPPVQRCPSRRRAAPLSLATGLSAP
eukprot:14255188-Alexandrium_andersonii.AAC.1